MSDILNRLRALYDARGDEIEHWFATQRGIAAPYLYSSVDLRHAGHKLAPVDTNLYPAGFNNLSLAARRRASRYIASAIGEQVPGAKRILIVPENHTRNLYYLENLAVLAQIVAEAGFEVHIGSLASEEPLALSSQSGLPVMQTPLLKESGKLVARDGFVPDAVILNNDLTSGLHPLLENIAQPVLPPTRMGWFQRRKSVHFAQYQRLAEDFARTFALDPWLISAGFHACGKVDFRERDSLECVAKAVDDLIARTREKYSEHGIAGEPYAFVKADSGTYGMGIMTVQSGAEILEINKKERNKMQVIKEGARVSEVIIQEGIPTIDTVEGHPAEPMVYMIDGLPVGGMYRTNRERDALSNLNAAGMAFVGMCDEQETADADRKSVRECDFRAYGLIAAIAALAAGREEYGRA